MELKTLLGLVSSSNALTEIGHFIQWREILTLSCIVFAISEFMEKNKFRAYVFKMSNLSRDIFGLIILSNLCVIIANILPMVNRMPLPIPLLHYPAFWELLSLITFTFLLGIVLIFSLFTDSFIPRITRLSCKEFFFKIRNKILYDHTDESFAAISAILDRNLEVIFKYASKYDKDWNIQGSHFKTPFDAQKVSKRDQSLVNYSKQLIDIAMSDKNYCHYLSENEIGFVLRIINKTNKYRFWGSGGWIFYNSLCKELFTNDQSFLSKELEFRGMGVQRPVYNALFKAFGILDWYRPFQSFGFWEEQNFSEEIIKKYTLGLEVSIKEYFRAERCILISETPNIALSVALKNLSQILSSICVGLKEYKSDEIYRNRYRNVIMVIHVFFGRSHLGRYLMGDSDYVPKLAKEDLLVSENSLTEGIVESIFDFMNALTLLENDDYARFLTTEIFWLILPVVKDEGTIRKNMEEKLLNLLKERVEENKQGHYPPMVKLLINIYGLEFHSGIRDEAKIGKYIETEFKNSLAEQILSDPIKRKEFLPSKYVVNQELKQIIDLNGQIIYQVVVSK